MRKSISGAMPPDDASLTTGSHQTTYSRELIPRHRTLDGFIEAVSQADGDRVDRRGRFHDAGGAD